MQHAFDLPRKDYGDARDTVRPSRRFAGLLQGIAPALALGVLLAVPQADAAANEREAKTPVEQKDVSGAAATHAEKDTRYGDWELVCKAQENSGRSACRLQQAQAVNGGKDIVFLFNIARQDKQRVAIISTPLNVYLPAGLELKIDGGQSRRVAFETCNISGCHAGFAMNSQLLGALRKGKALTVGLRDTKATAISVKVSLNGISAGIDALDAAVP